MSLRLYYNLFFSPDLAYFVKPSNLIYFAALALPSALAGLGGYYVAGRKYKKQTSE